MNRTGKSKQRLYIERVNRRALTLVFSVDRIRLTVDIRSSFRPVFRISGRSSNAQQINMSPTHQSQKDIVKI